jgi:hypothetical protein
MQHQQQLRQRGAHAAAAAAVLTSAEAADWVLALEEWELAVESAEAFQASTG